MALGDHELKMLVNNVTQCTLCEANLPLGPRPVIQIDTASRILIAGQAPGIRVHQSGIPFNDPSGDRLRQWMGIPKDVFYDEKQIAILPMGFCYPGTGKSGDLPPRQECAEKWRRQLIDSLPNIELVLAIGTYAQKWHMSAPKNQSLTKTVIQWEHYWPKILPMPHPSPRNNIWLKKNPWFEENVIPTLQDRVKNIIG